MTENHTMTDSQIWDAVAAERRSLHALLTELPESAWDHQSLCADWRVRDVVAHVALSAHANLTWILRELLRARGNLDRAIRDTAIRHADRTPTPELLAELQATIPTRTTALGTTPADRLMDLLVHGQDIAVPLNLPYEMPTPAAQVALNRIWTTSAPFHARKKLRGYHLSATDTDWAAGHGKTIAAPAATLLMLVTGRIDVEAIVQN
ncbi:maleylpyruvate isomerase family mycothiol-dependent enzyme [Nocardia sp. XZ_19_385]|uniref:maleylpyruvate isomerase family mycothiol-dependent enzyme n=1 Tax=Nocardia sp. XZ_19_385 TaxID=2769488 RepID=UPI00189096B7|nr:maleylpyruvate isomerase family mycothiol-dependent enzyme [Nocardia sp. XZ_19_385]